MRHPALRGALLGGALAVFTAPVLAQTSAPATLLTPFHPESVGSVPGTLELTQDPAILDELLALDEVVLNDIFLPSGRVVSLVLERSDFDFSTFGIYVDGQPAEWDSGDLSLWHGEVTGAPGSGVMLALSSLGTYGWIDDGADFVHVSSFPDPELGWNAARVRMFTDEALVDAGPLIGPEQCKTDSLRHPDTGSDAHDDDPDLEFLGNQTLEAEVAVETDYQLYQIWNNLAAEQNYMTALLGAISDRYNQQIDVVLTYPYLQFYTNSNDPWSSPETPGADTIDMLFEFRDAWQFNIPGNADLAHFISGASLGGGVAYLDVLCNDEYGFGVSANLSGGVSFPVQQGSNTWDFMVIAHELGHNFASPHTHDACPPIDECAPSGYFGQCQNQQVCTNQGTIMSYCHLCPGGMNNMTLFFHPQTETTMRNAAESAPCLDTFGGPDCNNNGVPDDQDISNGTSNDCDNNGVPDECDPDCDNDGIPDDCETDCNNNGQPDDCDTAPDCNSNGIPDSCDVAVGTSNDCDNNGVPDECQADCDNDGTPDGCEPDCNNDGTPDDCEPDCNNNGTPDGCETGNDCNGNGVPDDCETGNDCNNNGIPDPCDVGAGTSNDCNGNFIPDECEPDCSGDGIPDACEPDCNGNQVPDACETGNDCNQNGFPDECDIGLGTSNDCNVNFIPDECEPDCDNDGVPDDCEPDCNSNGTPDDCEGLADCNSNGVADDCESFTDCNNNGVPDECDVGGGGSSNDCNVNFIPDECEPDCNNDGIPDACETDCNGNGTPDACESGNDCNQNGVPDECDLGSGTSADCNFNFIPDECDPDCDNDNLPDDCETDCNNNGTPDECENFADCNSNGTPDDCDIAAGTSSDTNSNGVPDECECSAVYYCVTAPNSAGSGGLISYSGSLSIGQNDLVLEASDLPSNQFGVFYYGPDPLQQPFGDGFRCITGGATRFPVVASNGQGDASYAVDFQNLPFGGFQILPGSDWNFQYWYRDPQGPVGSGFNLTDAVNLTFCD